MTYRFRQCVNAIAFKYFIEPCPVFQNEDFDVAMDYNFQ